MTGLKTSALLGRLRVIMDSGSSINQSREV